MCVCTILCQGQNIQVLCNCNIMSDTVKGLKYLSVHTNIIYWILGLSEISGNIPNVSQVLLFLVVFF